MKMNKYDNRPKIPDSASCGNCRYCDFAKDESEKFCEKIQHSTVPEALCYTWEKKSDQGGLGGI